MINYEMYFYLKAGNDYWVVESALAHERDIAAGDFVKIPTGEKLEVKEVSIELTNERVVHLRLETLPVPLPSIAFYESELSQAGIGIAKVGKS